MKNADVTAFIAEVRSTHGRTIGAYEACTILGAKDVLAADPTNVHAQNVLKHFAKFLATGEQQPEVDRFQLPDDCIFTEEEKAEQEARRQAYVELYRKYALIGIEKGDYTAAKAFRDKHKLTCEQILAMSDEEFVSHAEIVSR